MTLLCRSSISFFLLLLPTLLLAQWHPYPDSATRIAPYASNGITTIPTPSGGIWLINPRENASTVIQFIDGEGIARWSGAGLNVPSNSDGVRAPLNYLRAVVATPEQSGGIFLTTREISDSHQLVALNSLGRIHWVTQLNTYPFATLPVDSNNVLCMVL